MKRALRRHHRQRMIARALHMYPGQPVHRLWRDRTPCSCSMCGNRRRWLGLPPIQERRALSGPTADQQIADAEAMRYDSVVDAIQNAAGSSVVRKTTLDASVASE